MGTPEDIDEWQPANPEHHWTCTISWDGKTLCHQPAHLRHIDIAHGMCHQHATLNQYIPAL